MAGLDNLYDYANAMNPDSGYSKRIDRAVEGGSGKPLPEEGGTDFMGRAAKVADKWMGKIGGYFDEQATANASCINGMTIQQLYDNREEITSAYRKAVMQVDTRGAEMDAGAYQNMKALAGNFPHDVGERYQKFLDKSEYQPPADAPKPNLECSAPVV